MKISLVWLDPLKQALQPFNQQLIDRFNKLETRDRTALVVLTVFMLAVLFYVLVWSPIHGAVAAAKSQYEQQRELVAWMKSHEAEARAVGANLSSSGTAGVTGSLYSLVNSMAGQKSLSLKRYEPDGDDKLRVWLESVPFNNFVVWLQALVEKGIVISNISVDAQDDAGKVNAKVIFSRL